MDISLFREVVVQYKVVFFDSYGVLKKHSGMIEGVKEMFQFLTDEGVEFYIITNDASRSPELLAKAYHEAGKRSSGFKIFFSPVSRFVSSYILNRGFLDGKAGWIIALISYKETKQKYKLLKELQRS